MLLLLSNDVEQCAEAIKLVIEKVSAAVDGVVADRELRFRIYEKLPSIAVEAMGQPVDEQDGFSLPP